MKDLLKVLSISSIQLGDITYSSEQIKTQWLGSDIPASSEDIESAETRLGIKLPDDYKQFLLITNGFAATNNVEPQFEPIQKIDYLKNIDDFLVSVWKQDGTMEIGYDLEKSILIGGIDEEQCFLLIPPENNEGWKYWKFASWIPGEDPFDNLEGYFSYVLDFNKKNLQ
jgi:cell wall assembly regulator SMI1